MAAITCSSPSGPLAVPPKSCRLLLIPVLVSVTRLRGPHAGRASRSRESRVLPLIRTERWRLPAVSLPSVPEFHRLNRIPALAGLRVADCHRRFGFSPTPEHILFAVYNAPMSVLFRRCRRRRRGLRIGIRPVEPRCPCDRIEEVE